MARHKEFTNRKSTTSPACLHFAYFVQEQQTIVGPFSQKTFFCRGGNKESFLPNRLIGRDQKSGLQSTGFFNLVSKQFFQQNQNQF